MKLRFTKSDVVRGIVLGVSAVGVLPFLFSLYLWGSSLVSGVLDVMKGDEVYFNEFINAIPAVVLLGGFLSAGVFAWKGKEGCGLILIWSIIAAVIFFIHDATNNLYQEEIVYSLGDGSHRKYYNWPLYKGKNENIWHGLIDKTGRTFGWDELEHFSEGPLYLEIDGKYGYIDKETKAVVIKPEFDAAESFSEDFAAVKIDEKWGYINKKGEMVIKPRFDFALGFSEGLAAVEIDGKFGYIDVRGKVVIEPQFDWIQGFEGGLARVEINKKWGVVDRTGRMVTKPRFEWIDAFADGMAKVWIDGKYGYIDKSGQIVIEPQSFLLAGDFSDGLARVSIGDKRGFIDKTGAFVERPYFDKAYEFSEGLALVRVGKWYGFIDTNGEIVIEPQLFNARGFSEGLACAVKNYRGKWGYIDKRGKFVIEPQFYHAESFHKGRALAEKLKTAISRVTAYALVIGFGVGFVVLHKGLRYYSKIRAGAG